MNIIRTALIVALLVEITTTTVGFIQKPHYMQGLGIFDYLMYPGAIIGWLAIWGDGPGYQCWVEIGISAAFNCLVAFIAVILLSGAWRIFALRTNRARNK